MKKIIFLAAFPFLAKSVKAQYAEGLSVHLGLGYDKLSVRDADMKKIGGGGEWFFNKRLSAELDASYGLDQNGEQDRTRSFAARLIGYYAPVSTPKHRIKIGAGAAFRNICDLYVTEWSVIDGVRRTDRTRNDIFNIIGVVAGIGYDHQICSKWAASVNAGYQHFNADIRAYSFGLNVSYKLF